MWSKNIKPLLPFLVLLVASVLLIFALILTRDTKYAQEKLLFPAIIAVLASSFSFLGTFYFSVIDGQRIRINETVTFVERLVIELEKLEDYFNSLLTDIEEKNYYSWKNLGSETSGNIFSRLNHLMDNITLIENLDLRKKIISSYDSALNLSAEIKVVEIRQTNNHNEDKRKSVIFDKLETIKTTFLPHNIVFKEDAKDQNKIKAHWDNTGKKGSDAYINTANEMFFRLSADFAALDDSVRNENENINRARLILGTKIVGVLAQLRDTKTTLKVYTLN